MTLAVSPSRPTPTAPQMRTLRTIQAAGQARAAHGAYLATVRHGAGGSTTERLRRSSVEALVGRGALEIVPDHAARIVRVSEAGRRLLAGERGEP